MSEGHIAFREAQQGQPEALARATVRVAEQLADVGRSARAWPQSPTFVAMGASYAACAVPVSLFARAGRSAHRAIASEIEHSESLAESATLVGVSQSGRSPETIAALERVPLDHRWALTNVAGSPLAQAADQALDLGTQADSYASTTGLTATIAGLSMFARVALGSAVADALAEWDGIAEQVLATEDAVRDVIAEVVTAGARVVGADVVASGPSRAAAEAGALLLREVCRVPSAASTTRNYLHGEMESAGGTLHVVIGAGRELRLAEMLAQAGHRTLLVTTAPVVPSGTCHVVRLPEVTDPVRVVLETVVLQHLAAGTAEARDLVIEDFVFTNDDTKVEILAG